MSEKEKRIMENVAKLPDTLMDRFLDKIEGAVMALDMTNGKEASQSERTARESPKVH